MTSEVSSDLHARAGQTAATPDWFCAPVLSGLDAELLLKAVEAGYTWSLRARLPEGGHEQIGTSVSREEALVAGFEDLVAWCGEQKEIGGKRHRKQAEQLQEWALQQERLVRTVEVVVAAASEPVAPLAMPAAALHVEFVPLNVIYDSPWNPRQVYPVEELEKLAASMRASGFHEWQPLVVRPIGETSEVWRSVAHAGAACYELGAGHRRRRAAEMAGLQVVPCVIREMSDEDFLDLLNFDNSGREDVHPLHEAAGWAQWMQRTGKGVLDIAARIGQSKEYVYQRLKYAALSEAARAAFLDGKVTARHAVLLARRPEAVQKAALKFLEPKWNGLIPTTRELEDWLRGDQTEDLAEARFDRADAGLLAGAGACATCPKLQSNDPGFVPAADVENDHERDDIEHRPQDCCLDPLCFRQKTDNHFVRVRTAMEQQSGGPVLEVSTSYSKSKKKGVLSSGQYDVVKSGGQLAVVVEGYSKVGETVRVKLKAVSPKETKESVQQREKDRAAAEKARQAAAQREIAIRERILDAVLAAGGGTIAVADLRGLAAAMLTGRGAESSGEWLCARRGVKASGWQAGQRLTEALPKLRDAEIVALSIELSVVHDFQSWNLERPPAALLDLAKRHKVDAVKIRAAMEEGAKASEGGTRREVEKPRAAKAKKKAGGKTPAKKKGGKK